MHAPDQATAGQVQPLAGHHSASMETDETYQAAYRAAAKTGDYSEVVRIARILFADVKPLPIPKVPPSTTAADKAMLRSGKPDWEAKILARDEQWMINW